MKKRILSALNIGLIISLPVSLQASAYSFSSPIPSTKTLLYGWHAILPSDGKVYHNWDVSDGLSARYSFFTDSGTIDPTDSRNTVGGRVSSLPGSSTAFIAASLKPSGSTFSTFDIVINSNYTFGNGSSESYNDYCGVFTHEFGHIFGLADLYSTSLEIIGKTKSNVPTMYYGNLFDGTKNIYYYLRSPEYDDISGKAAVASQIG